ncbi:glycosyltransferase [Demequina salsinemoris]|uniref:glycosyltransferase n=1 Tax=Demequina salsinemoris TaxID=577470 RepID=UPI000A000171|nr:glycosyltransferase [Demequina salsinemoris]
MSAGAVYDRLEGYGNRRVFVMLPYGLGQASWRERKLSGATWEETPYGYGFGGEFFDLSWSEDHHETSASNVLRRGIAKVLGFDVVHVWRNRRPLLRADVVWTHTEREHLAVALIKRVLRSRASFRTVAQTVWLWDRWARLSAPRRWLARWLLAAHDLEITHSQLNLAISRAEAPGRTTALCPFGTSAVTSDANMYDAAGNLVVSAGNDIDRDWLALAGAAVEMPEVEFVVFSGSLAAREVEWPANVRLETDARVQRIRAHYEVASAVVVPLRPNLHASGLTVALESMSAGVPLVVSDVGGIRPYVSGEGVELVPCGDANALAAGIRAVRHNYRQEISAVLRSRRLSRGLTDRDYVLRYCLATRSLLEDEDIPEALSVYESLVESES